MSKLPVIREIECKSVLSKSKISSYAVNCYVGCLHACVYCYARYMKRFTEHTEPWGKFVDVRINAPFILEKELNRASPGQVIMSSVCDGWQPLEQNYEVSRRCLNLLLRYGFPVTILTKNALVRNDFDILEGENVKLGATITTMDENLRRKIEPGASKTIERINVLKEAADRGIRVWVFIGPLMPFLSDTEENINAIFKALEGLKLDRIYYDKLNPRTGVWQSVKGFLGENYPYLIESYGRILYNETERNNYINGLNQLMKNYAESYNRIKEMGF